MTLRDFQRMTMPISLVGVIVLSFGGWYITSLEADVGEIKADLDALDDNFTDQQLKVSIDVSEIRTVQAVMLERMNSMHDMVKRLIDRED